MGMLRIFTRLIPTGTAQMVFAFFGDLATAWGAHQEAKLQKIRLVVIFNGGGFVTGESGDSGETHGAIAVILVNKVEHVAVSRIEA